MDPSGRMAEQIASLEAQLAELRAAQQASSKHEGDSAEQAAAPTQSEPDSEPNTREFLAPLAELEEALGRLGKEHAAGEGEASLHPPPQPLPRQGLLGRGREVASVTAAAQQLIKPIPPGLPTASADEGAPSEGTGSSIGAVEALKPDAPSFDPPTLSVQEADVAELGPIGIKMINPYAAVLLRHHSPPRSPCKSDSKH